MVIGWVMAMRHGRGGGETEQLRGPGSRRGAARKRHIAACEREAINSAGVAARFGGFPFPREAPAPGGSGLRRDVAAASSAAWMKAADAADAHFRHSCVELKLRG